MIDQGGEGFRRLGYHPVAGERQMQIYQANREIFLSLYDYIDNLGSASREKSLALTALQEAMMWTNAHVACNDVGVDNVG